MLEFIHCFVEVLDKHFGQVCELDIMNEPDVVSADQQFRQLVSDSSMAHESIFVLHIGRTSGSLHMHA